jgi:wobble nucleotide-excising tRNase
LSANEKLTEFWKKYTQAATPEISFEDRLEPVIHKLRDALAPLIARKLQSPLEKVEYSAEAMAAIDDWKALGGEVIAYNKGVETLNAAIQEVKASTVTKNSTSLQAELVKLQAQKIRFEAAAQAAIEAYDKAKEAKRDAEAEKDKAKEELDAYNDKIIGKYHASVNELLRKIGAAFTLKTVKVEYTGRTPRTGYTFELRGKEVDPGNDSTPAGTACFRNTLSSGDRNTLALAFFVAQLKNRSDLGNLIVVFDDPFTSLDAYRQTWTCGVLRRLSTEAKQVIVLSHSMEFLRLLAERCDTANLKTLKIDRYNRVDSRIIELNLEAASASATDKDLKTLRLYHLGDGKDELAAVRCIRPLLENFIRLTTPDQCPPGTGWLGTFLGEIHRADQASPLAVYKPIYADLDQLNTYTSKYAHDDGLSPVPNPDECAHMAKLTLEIVGRL